jgi:hypothetical protein
MPSTVLMPVLPLSLHELPPTTISSSTLNYNSIFLTFKQALNQPFTPASNT